MFAFAAKLISGFLTNCLQNPRMSLQTTSITAWVILVAPNVAIPILLGVIRGQFFTEVRLLATIGVGTPLSALGKARPTPL
jgi:hypothetical protein